MFSNLTKEHKRNTSPYGEVFLLVEGIGHERVCTLRKPSGGRFLVQSGESGTAVRSTGVDEPKACEARGRAPSVPPSEKGEALRLSFFTFGRAGWARTRRALVASGDRLAPVYAPLRSVLGASHRDAGPEPAGET